MCCSDSLFRLRGRAAAMERRNDFVQDEEEDEENKRALGFRQEDT
jgi:hypothetical protein